MYNISVEKRKEIFSFYLKYKDFFSEIVQDLFCDFINGKDCLCDVLLQFYTYFEAIDNEINPYYDFYNYLIVKHPNIAKQKVIEVACGYVPAISHLISLNNKMENLIIAMDPKIIPVNFNGIKKERNFFSLDTDIDNFDLIIAHCPCEALESIITKAVNEKKEFTIQMCKCSSNSVFFPSRFNWLYYIDSIYDKVIKLEDYDFTVEKEYLDFSYQIDAPIITARKRQLTSSTKFHR